MSNRNCTDLIVDDEWPSDSPTLNLRDYHVWGLAIYQCYTSKPTNTLARKDFLRAIRLTCANAAGTFHFVTCCGNASKQPIDISSIMFEPMLLSSIYHIYLP